MERKSVMMAVLVAAAACGGGTDRRAGTGMPETSPLSVRGERVIAPELSPDGVRIAYWAPADSGSLFTLMVANSDFSDPKATGFTSPDEGNSLTWSPDQSRLAAQIGNSVMVYDLKTGSSREVSAPGGGYAQVYDWTPDGTRLEVLQTASGGRISGALVDPETGAFTPAVPGETRSHFGFFLPDGKRYVYQVFDSAKATLWLADGTTGRRRQLTTEGFEEWAPPFPLSLRSALSPDGKELLYVSRRTGRNDIYAIPLDGGAPRQLTKDVRDDDAALWTPDGSGVVFRSERGGQSDLWLVPRDGGEAVRLTDSRETERVQGWRGGAAAPSLLFSSEDRLSGIWTVDLASGAERVLLEDSLRVRSLEGLSPDRSQVLSVQNRGDGVDELRVTDLKTGTSRTLLRVEGCVCSSSWSPDASTVVITSDRGGTLDVWTVRVADGTLTRVTDWPGTEQTAVYGDGGKSIYFIADRESKFNDAWKVSSAGGTPMRVTTSGTLLGLDPEDVAGQGVLAGALRATDGALVLHRLRPDGRLDPVWTGAGSSDAFIRPFADSVAVRVRTGPATSIRLVPLAGGTGREILPGSARPRDASVNGRRLLFTITSGATTDLGILDLATGQRRMVTNTPDAWEFGSAFGPGDTTVVVRRERRVKRYLTLTPPAAR